MSNDDGIFEGHDGDAQRLMGDREALKQCAYTAMESCEAREGRALLGLLIIRAHHSRSALACHPAHTPNHPPFLEYARHWIYSSLARLQQSSSDRDVCGLRRTDLLVLTEILGLEPPNVLHLPPGRSYWEFFSDLGVLGDPSGSGDGQAQE